VAVIRRHDRNFLRVLELVTPDRDHIAVQVVILWPESDHIAVQVVITERRDRPVPPGAAQTID
jgi:hypothetical protein